MDGMQLCNYGDPLNSHTAESHLPVEMSPQRVSVVTQKSSHDWAARWTVQQQQNIKQ